MSDFIRLLEKLLDCALTNSGVRGAVAWFTVFLLGLLVVEATLYIVGLTQFRRDAGVFFIVCLAIDNAIMCHLGLQNPWKWFKVFNGIAFIISVIFLCYRICSGNWEPIIPEYVPAS